MWPDELDSWWDDWADDAERTATGRLSSYPSLRVFARRTASQGVARAREIAGYLRQYRGYFAHRIEFSRWLRVVSYREALRLVLQLEPVEMVLEELGGEPRRLLRWRYIDQLTDEEVARMLDLRTSNRLLFDAAAGRQRSIDAYLELCRAFDRRSAARAAGGPHRPDYASVFPLFPGLGRDGLPLTA